MIFVFSPLYEIVEDIFPYLSQFLLIPDDPFVIVALPERDTRGFSQGVDVASSDRFKAGDE